MGILCLPILNIGFGGSRNKGIPFIEDLSLYYNDRDELDITEKDSLVDDALIMPAASKFNGTDDYLLSDQYLVGGSAIVIDFEFILQNFSGNNCIFACGGYGASVAGIGIYLDLADQIKVFTSSGSATATCNFQDFFIADAGKKVRGRITWDGLTGGTMTCEVWGDQLNINGVGVVDYDSQSLTTTHAWSGNSDEVMTVGIYRTSSPLGYFSSNLMRVALDGIFDIYPTGLGDYEYDVSGRMNFTWQGTGDRTEYVLHGNDYYFTNGWKLYKKASAYEYVPIDADVAAIVADGYSLVNYGTYNGGNDFVNMFPCLIDLDPNDATPAVLDVMDRSNATYQNAISRGQLIMMHLIHIGIM